MIEKKKSREKWENFWEKSASKYFSHAFINERLKEENRSDKKSAAMHVAMTGKPSQKTFFPQYLVTAKTWFELLELAHAVELLSFNC